MIEPSKHLLIIIHFQINIQPRLDMAQLRAHGSKIDASNAVLGSMDVRYRHNGNSKEPTLKMMGENPLAEVKSRLGNLELGPLCKWLLTYKMKPVSRYDQRLNITMAERISTSSSTKDMYCSPCRAYHTRALPAEIGIICGDSQASGLHCGADGKTVVDDYHIEYYIAPGRTVDELCAGVCFMYAHAESSLKICLVAGYNDYIRGHSRKEIIDAIARFKQMTEELDAMHGRPPNSSNVVCSTLILCPALVMMSGLPIDRSMDCYNKEGRRLQDLNQQILDLNEAHGYGEVSTPLCESIGRRCSWKNNRRRYSIQKSYFREKNRRDMLHLSPRYKYLLFNKVKRTISRMVSSQCLTKLPSKSKYGNKFELVKSLKDLTIDGSKELKSRGKTTDKSTTSARKPDVSKDKPGNLVDTGMETGLSKMSISGNRNKGKQHHYSSYNPRDNGRHASSLRSVKSVVKGDGIAKKNDSSGSSGKETGGSRKPVTQKGAIKKKDAKEPGRKSSPPITRAKLRSTSSNFSPVSTSTPSKPKSRRAERRDYYEFVRGRLEDAFMAGSIVKVPDCKIKSRRS